MTPVETQAVTATPPAKKRAFPGIVSVAIAGLVPCALGMLLATLYVLNKVTLDHDAKHAISTLIVFSFFVFAPVLHGVGLLVGVVGLFPRRSSKLMALAGVLANLALPIAGAAIFLLLAGLDAASVVR